MPAGTAAQQGLPCARADLHVAVRVAVQQQLAAQLGRQEAESGRAGARQRRRHSLMVCAIHFAAGQQLV
jgi:hypothetical protein